MNKIMYFVIALIALFSNQIYASEISGKVVSISDGDTISLLVESNTGKETLKIRLAQIDAPEKAQPWGQKSKQALSDMIFNKNISAKIETKDRYGRVVANLYHNEVWVNKLMVESGNAWMYRQYSKNGELEQAEAEAKEKKSGLWSLPESEIIPPWEWRKTEKNVNSSNKEKSQTTEKNNRASKEFECGSKRTCGQMNSCEEAMFHLKSCGLNSLDRDRDGVPCESICR